MLAADFAERLGRGETAPVQVLVDGSDPNTAGLVQNYVAGRVGQLARAGGGLAATRWCDRPPGRPLVVGRAALLVQPEIDSQ